MATDLSTENAFPVSKSDTATTGGVSITAHSQQLAIDVYLDDASNDGTFAVGGGVDVTLPKQAWVRVWDRPLHRTMMSAAITVKSGSGTPALKIKAT